MLAGVRSPESGRPRLYERDHQMETNDKAKAPKNTKEAQDLIDTFFKGLGARAGVLVTTDFTGNIMFMKVGTIHERLGLIEFARAAERVEAIRLYERGEAARQKAFDQSKLDAYLNEKKTAEAVMTAPTTPPEIPT